MPAWEKAMAQAVVLEGCVSVRAALEAGRRPLYEIYVHREAHGRDLAQVGALAARRGVRVLRVNDEELARLARGRLHGGIVALAGTRGYDDLDNLTGARGDPFVVMLDGLEDPYNFGHAVRALYAAGVDGVVIRLREWSGAEGTILRASAGAFDRLPIARVANPAEAAEALRARGLLVACAAEEPRAVSIYDAAVAPPCLLVIGGERRGISREMVRQADLLVRIPYGSQFRHSLGLTAAASILAFEVTRRRGARETG